MLRKRLSQQISSSLAVFSPIWMNPYPSITYYLLLWILHTVVVGYRFIFCDMAGMKQALLFLVLCGTLVSISTAFPSPRDPFVKVPFTKSSPSLAQRDVPPKNVELPLHNRLMSYTLALQMGNPPVQIAPKIDTGSPLFWVPHSKLCPKKETCPTGSCKLCISLHSFDVRV